MVEIFASIIGFRPSILDYEKKMSQEHLSPHKTPLHKTGLFYFNINNIIEII